MKAKEKETLTRAEWLVMEVLWKKSPMFLSEIMEAMQNTVDWKNSSYMTYLKRLTDSGYLGFRSRSGNRCYFPIRARGECVEEESSYVLSKMSEDSARLLLVSMVQKADFGEEEKAQLTELIAKLTGGVKRGETHADS